MKNEIKERILNAIKISPRSMAYASKLAGMPYRTFIYRAKQLNVYAPNQSGKGLSKKKPKHLIISLDEILQGKHPQYQTNKLRLRLLKEKIKKNKCDKCKIESWNNRNITIELDHINGNSNDHRLDNLQMLCPNCHSQTDTFRGRNIKNKR